MVLDKTTKEQVTKQFARHEGDTGSSEVQIALASARITYLTKHLQMNRKDFSSKRGLQQILARRA